MRRSTGWSRPPRSSTSARWPPPVRSGSPATGSPRSSAVAPDGDSTAPRSIADGAHARADAYVSLAVIASAAVVAIGLRIADPLIGLAISVIILRITWQSWQTVSGHSPHSAHDH